MAKHFQCDDGITCKPYNWVRLACVGCDIEDYDGITPEELSNIVAIGAWSGVDEVQSYAESIFSGPGSCGEWWTHLGWCPECLGILVV